MSFDIFSAFATDETLENNGVEFTIGKDSKLLIARAGNRKYGKALMKLAERRSVELQGDDEASDAASDQVIIEVMAETILLGWTGLSFKGENMGEYTQEKARKLLAIKDFRKHVSKLADQLDAYKVKTEAAAGNV